MKGLKGAKAIVTGGASGGGHAICRRPGSDGCPVGVLEVSRRSPDGAKIARGVASGGGRAICRRPGSDGCPVGALDVSRRSPDGAKIARGVASGGGRAICRRPGSDGCPVGALDVSRGGAGGAKLAHDLARATAVKRLAQPDDRPGIVAFPAGDQAGHISGRIISVPRGLAMSG